MIKYHHAQHQWLLVVIAYKNSHCYVLFYCCFCLVCGLTESHLLMIVTKFME